MAGQCAARLDMACLGWARHSVAGQGFQNQKEEQMRVAIAELESVTPYSQSKPVLVDKLPKESANDFEKRTWRERLHTTKEGNVFIPLTSIKNCLSEVARYLGIQIPGKGKSTYTKHFESGILITENILLPDKKDDIKGEWLFVPADGKRAAGSGSGNVSL